MTFFYDLSTRAKLVVGFGFLAAIALGVGLTGFLGLSAVDDYLTRLHDEHFAVALTVAETGSNLNAVRASLMGMMAAKTREAQESLHQRIKDLTVRIDAGFADLERLPLDADVKARLADVRNVWGEFRDTRDRELIPAIYAGRLAEASELATGIQADRYRRFSAGAAELVKQARAQALRFKQEAAARYELSIVLFGGLSAAAVVVALALAVFYARIMGAPLAQAVVVLEAVADGDFTKQLDVATRDDIGRMADAMNRAVGAMHAALGDVAVAARHAATASGELSAAADQLASGTQEQASSLQETAASLEQITGTVKQNADNARQANELATGSRDAADKGGDVVRKAVDAMTEINRSSRRIAEIITTIDEIAFQTNLLALNAAVEAARAGEQGRGFAVVAAEVRNLAQRSATAAKEIKGLIEDSVAKVDVGSELVNRSGQTLEEIVTSVKRVTDIIAEIAAASAEQSSGIDQVNRAVSEMDQVVQSNSAQTEELSSTAQAMAAQAEELQALVSRFKLGDAHDRAAALAPPGAFRVPQTPTRAVRRRPAVARRATPALVTAEAANRHGAEFHEV